MFSQTISKQAVLCATVLAGLFSFASTVKATDFFQGKTIRLIIPAAPGGGYDAYGRVVARLLQKHIPGNPNVVLQNMPGGGGITPANYLYHVAPKDGTVIGSIQNTVPFEPLFENKLATFDAAKFGWLGTPTTETALYITYHTSPVKTLADAQQHPITVGSLGNASTQAFYGRIFNEVLGLKARLVNGYTSSIDITLAMERGEVEANSAPFWSSLKAARPDWYNKKLANFLFQYGARPHPELKDVPFALDHVKAETDRSLLIAASAPLALGRPFAVPPEIPRDRLMLLRQSFIAAVRDPGFQALCESQRIDCDDVRDGPQLEAVVKQVYEIPLPLRQRLVAIYAGTSSK
jgi:hypothetical protein